MIPLYTKNTGLLSQIPPNYTQETANENEKSECGGGGAGILLPTEFLSPIIEPFEEEIDVVLGSERDEQEKMTTSEEYRSINYSRFLFSKPS